MTQRASSLAVRGFRSSAIAREEYDVVVVGGGPGGYVAAIKASQLGLKTVRQISDRSPFFANLSQNADAATRATRAQRPHRHGGRYPCDTAPSHSVMWFSFRERSISVRIGWSGMSHSSCHYVSGGFGVRLGLTIIGLLALLNICFTARPINLSTRRALSRAASLEARASTSDASLRRRCCTHRTSTTKRRMTFRSMASSCLASRYGELRLWIQMCLRPAARRLSHSQGVRDRRAHVCSSFACAARSEQQTCTCALTRTIPTTNCRCQGSVRFGP